MEVALRTTHVASTDEDLVSATRRGNDRAFEQLYSRYQQRISAYAFGLTRDHGRAEDITQEVFMSALRRLRATDRPVAFRPWIYEIARNACIDEHRRTKRTQEVPIERDEDSSEPKLALASPAADTEVESRQRFNDLRGAFRGLSERHHKIIVMRELEGLTYAQIGEELGMSRMMVESTLFRARRRLTEEYDDLASGRRCEHVQGLLQPRAGRHRSLGLRDRRALTNHLQHCHSCRQQARVAGVEESYLRTGTLGKVAALLPFPIWRFGFRATSRVASWFDSSSAYAGSGRGVAAVAAALAAVAGGGVATRAVEHALNSRPASPTHAAASQAGFLAAPAASVTGGSALGAISGTVQAPGGGNVTAGSGLGAGAIVPGQVGAGSAGGSAGTAVTPGKLFSNGAMTATGGSQRTSRSSGSADHDGSASPSSGTADHETGTKGAIDGGSPSLGGLLNGGSSAGSGATPAGGTGSGLIPSSSATPTTKPVVPTGSAPTVSVPSTPSSPANPPAGSSPSDPTGSSPSAPSGLPSGSGSGSGSTSGSGGGPSGSSSGGSTPSTTVNAPGVPSTGSGSSVPSTVTTVVGGLGTGS
jgi:RNA polymerase sigma factor (sigma-70 family)